MFFHKNKNNSNHETRIEIRFMRYSCNCIRIGPAKLVLFSIVVKLIEVLNKQVHSQQIGLKLTVESFMSCLDKQYECLYYCHLICSDSKLHTHAKSPTLGTN